jgi:hypothetical protein
MAGAPRPIVAQILQVLGNDSVYDGLHQVMQAAMSTGRQIVALIETIYPNPHDRYPFRLSTWWWITLILVVAGAIIDTAACFPPSAAPRP